MRWLNSQKINRVEVRGNFRVNERFPVAWRLQDREVNGTAKVCNISETGMMLETNSDIPLPKDSILAFNLSEQAKADFLPPLGRMVWSRKKSLTSASCLCGIEFVDPAQEILLRLRERVGDKITRLKNAEDLRFKVGAVLFAIMAALLIFFVIQQALIHRRIERSNHMMLVSASSQSDLYAGILSHTRIQESVLIEMTKDLKATKALLIQTENMLAQTEQQNTAANNQLIALKASNESLVGELSLLEVKLRPYEGNVENVSEAKAAIRLHKNKIHEVKRRIRSLKRQAYLAKVAAQKERDRIALERGNRGYITKDAKPFRLDSAISQKRIEIDVRLVE